MRKIFCGILNTLLVICCNQNATIAQHKDNGPLLPYLALERNKLDTTYEYDILEKPINANLPKNVFGKRLSGAVEFFAMLNNEKRIVSIKLIAYEFYRKKKLVYFNNMGEDTTRCLIAFLLSLLQNEPVKQNKPAVGEVHPTYCFIRF